MLKSFVKMGIKQRLVDIVEHSSSSSLNESHLEIKADNDDTQPTPDSQLKSMPRFKAVLIPNNDAKMTQKYGDNVVVESELSGRGDNSIRSYQQQVLNE